MDKLKLFKVSAACATFLASIGYVSLQSGNATIQIYNGTSFTEGTYCAAYELYGDGSDEVIVGNIAEGENQALIGKLLGKIYENGTNAVLRLNGAKFLEPKVFNVNATQYCLSPNGNGTVVAATGPIIGERTTLAFQFNDTVSNGTTVVLGVCNADGSYLGNSTMLKLDKGLRASCNQVAQIIAEWDAPDDCTNATLIEIKRRHLVLSTWDLTAELNAEDDFKSFVFFNSTHPHNVYRATVRLGCYEWNDYARPYCLNFGKSFNETMYNSTTSLISLPTEKMTVQGVSDRPNGCTWVLGNNYDATKHGILSFSFDVVSMNPQPQDVFVKLVLNNGNRTITCNRVNDTTWTCNVDCTACLACTEDELVVTLGSTGIKSPTVWYLSNYRVNRICTDAKVKAVCCGIKEGPIGFWYGGLEAIVPFVRLDEEKNFYTTIKFSSRYHNDVKVYAIPMIPPQYNLLPHNMTNFSNNRAPWMLKPVIEVGVIRTSSPVITITAKDLFDKLNVPEALRKEGIPVKFVFGVPNLQTCIGQPVDGRACIENHADPIIQGYAAYDTPLGTRRVPIKFKSFKQGSYTE